MQPSGPDQICIFINISCIIGFCGFLFIYKLTIFYLDFVIF